MRRKERKKLSAEFYLDDDVVKLARLLLGKALYTQINGIITGGIITETEAYRGPEDRASHAYNNRRTKRTEVMFHKGGICYVYLCYGIHPMLNIVTNEKEIPHAILIRSLEPREGLETMLQRRGKDRDKGDLMKGPGCVAKALGIDLTFNGLSLSSNQIWLEEGFLANQEIIEALPRIGVDYAGEDAYLPWRFLWNPLKGKT